MKKILSILLVVSALLSYSSCKNEVDDIFPEQTSLRIEKGLEEYAKVLSAAPNGWVMQYYGDTKYGGYAVLCKFAEDGSVVVANEFFDADKTETTHYKLEQSKGIILSFDQYSELFHFFSDPVNSKGYGSAGTGFGGDLEFYVMQGSAEQFVLKGKKHGSKIVMTPVPENMTWEQYLNKVKAVEDEMYATNYDITVGDQVLKTKKSYRSLIYTIENEEGQKITETMPFAITPDGYVFYDELSFSGKDINGFKYQASADAYDEAGDATIKLHKVVLDPNELFVNGVWYVDYSTLGKTATSRWTTMKNKLAAEGENLLFAAFGTYSTDFGFTFAPGDDEGYYLCELYFDYRLNGKDEITMWFNGNGDALGNGNYYWTAQGDMYGVRGALVPFGAGVNADESSARTFIVTTDDQKRPTYVTLSDTKSKNNVITLMAKEVVFPFGEPEE